ncbi:MAG: hypothetical protein IKQ10_05920 [Oscillospiraceae bacterium]|nr:hypothetical protein [Bacteroidales bacterium]MBR6114707.1 hypothetical protein [Oscillospiraceae bacterium]
MKRLIKRLLAGVLCAMALVSLAATPSDAFSEYYTTVTKSPETKEYATLQMPGKNRLYTSNGKRPKRAEVKASWKNGGIYFMPCPELGHGVLGSVETGTPVTIFAEQNHLYFFMTDDGRMGWNGKGFFTKPTDLPEDEAEPLSEGSDLTVGDVLTVSDFLAGRHRGVASEFFYADKALVILKSGESEKVTVHGWFSKATYDFKTVDGTSAEAAWCGKKFSSGHRDVEFTAREPGVTTFKFTNSKNKRTFQVMVIVL